MKSSGFNERPFPILKRYLLPQPNLKLAFMKDFSYITNSHPAYIENLYQSYMQDPGSVDPEMKKFFEGFDFAVSSGKASSNGGTTTTTSDHASVGTLDW